MTKRDLLRQALIQGSEERVEAALDRLLLIYRLKRGGRKPMPREARTDMIRRVLRWWRAPAGRSVDTVVRPEHEENALWLAAQLDRLLRQEPDPHDENYREWRPCDTPGTVYDVGQAIQRRGERVIKQAAAPRQGDQESRGIEDPELVFAIEIAGFVAYDPLTGCFARRRAFDGQPAGSPIEAAIDGGGYRVIGLGESVRFRAARLACLLTTGAWPRGEMDHKNGVRHDDRWDNLRDVSHTINMQNQRRAHVDSRSGLLGASILANGSIVAAIGHDGKVTYLGRFDSPEKAHEAYLEAKRRLHPGCTI